MDKEFKEGFIEKWNKYFPGADLPIGFYYTDVEDKKVMPKTPKGHRCIICDLAKVRAGKTFMF